jgi:hypothetical protein
MPPDPDDEPHEAHRLRHDLLSALTIVCGQTQLLQRQLRRMDGFADGDRQRLEAGLGVVLTTARALGASIEQLAVTPEDHDNS